MSMKKILKVVVVLSFIASTQALTSRPASAACDNSAGIAGKTVSLQRCISGTGPSTYVAKDPSWTTDRRYPDKPCTYTVNGQTVVSYLGDGHMAGGAEQTGICLINNYGAGTDVVGIAKKAIPSPKPTADFKEKFLTGAEVQFSSTDLQAYAVTVPNFPNAKITITPLTIKWDFGDGTTSTELNPKHTYQDIAPIPTNHGLHVAHVTVTGDWQVTLLDGNLGDVVNLGNYTGTGALDRSIVQVWSEQTEPNS